MRPPVPNVPLPRARKASFEQLGSDPRITSPATFFLSRRPDHDSYSDSDSDDAEVPQDSMYGVQSLDEAVHQATLAASECDDIPAADSGKLSPNPASHNNNEHDATEAAQRRSAFRAFELLHFNSDPSSSFSSLQPPPSDPASSRPLTPLNLSNPDDHPSSLPSSPKSLSDHSLKPLDDISITDEQAIVSGEEDGDGRDVPEAGTDSMPQLIMPSLRMPSRRPFTERGKAMGRLKVLLAGASGSGKTSLIKSIVQECEHIVHVDPFPPSSSSSTRRRRSSRSQSHGMRSAMLEVHASTKPYPSWWSDLEDSRILRRRKSMGDIVLERNLCFVDTPVTSSSRTEQTEVIIYYMRQQLGRAIGALDSSNVDFQNMLAGNGGSQVDAIIYLISQDTLEEDVDCIRKLCDFTNVIPVIAKSDLMSSDQIAALKSTFQKQIRAADAKPFLFGNQSPGQTDTSESQMPFAVSSAKSNDEDTMDASTLMSPDYVQPLVSSELNLLVQNLFDRDHLAWMRHSASKKLVQRQYEQQRPMQSPRTHQRSPSLSSSMSILTSPNHSLSSPSFASPALSGSLDYTLARITDHTHREEGLAQVHLVKWAADLQRSLRNERERYAAMARGERAAWLTERLSECVVDGSLVPITTQQTPTTFGGPLRVSPEKARGNRVQLQTKQNIKYHHITGLIPHDPLGVVWWTDDLRQRGWKMFQVIGSFGVVGGLALWLANFWGFPPQSLADVSVDWW